MTVEEPGPLLLSPALDPNPSSRSPLIISLPSSLFQIIASLDEDPAAQSKQLTLRLQQIAAALENKVTDL